MARGANRSAEVDLTRVEWSAVGARFEEPKATRGWGVGRGAPSHWGRGLEIFFAIFELKKASFGTLCD